MGSPVDPRSDLMPTPGWPVGDGGNAGRNPDLLIASPQRLDAAGSCALALINALSAYGPGDDVPGAMLLEAEHALLSSTLSAEQMDSLRAAFEPLASLDG